MNLEISYQLTICWRTSFPSNSPITPNGAIEIPRRPSSVDHSIASSPRRSITTLAGCIFWSPTIDTTSYADRYCCQCSHVRDLSTTPSTSILYSALSLMTPAF